MSPLPVCTHAPCYYRCILGHDVHVLESHMLVSCREGGAAGTVISLDRLSFLQKVHIALRAWEVETGRVYTIAGGRADALVTEGEADMPYSCSMVYSLLICVMSTLCCTVVLGQSNRPS